MDIRPTRLADVLVIDPVVHRDERGFLFESYRVADFDVAGASGQLVQHVHSGSAGGTVRGLHYQLARPQGKLVRAVVGEVFDVAVDLRRSSPSFGQWVGETLTATNCRALWIPPGFAHGFAVLGDGAELLYGLTDYYVPGDEYAVRWDDPDLAIDWPLAPGCAPVVSPRDQAGKTLREATVYA